ncbi:Mediator of RNA polymerase II transcription subunit-like protein [Hapsidospora chrysogenum ATCC 11550]|uniref:Mediator of RNA polymerase II transcription subunit 10 n=1 Tax=Hapsidospora chrysogenum (strain ATCC 11550 / CBS 779.69 / DSM 880 / IAM 14645 / JCM 23072 / IMI 49137) TaxID=857340 RepID=A0A086THW3_HAPC1|nr:Mediator of RNA polymerase II transcription subunit-like protein [Hapsidospora chrysogenum ATCC 11550]
MAPVDRVDPDVLEQQLKDIIQDLYQLMVQVSTYDSAGRASKDVLTNEIKTLSRSLQTLHTSASPPNALPSVPPELLQYVENGRNPDIYTREFVELVRRGNQLIRGKTHAFAAFRDVLAADMAAAMPELRDDVKLVCETTGGSAPVVVGDGDGEAKQEKQEPQTVQTALAPTQSQQ